MNLILIHALTILLFGIQYDAYAFLPTTNEVVARCCSEEYGECCAESVNFAKPLRCDGMKLQTRIDVTLCIQKAMHGEHQPMLNLTDAVCCDVFADDDNDVKEHCLAECITVMQIPGLKNEKKLKRIKECKRTNPLYKNLRQMIRSFVKMSSHYTKNCKEPISENQTDCWKDCFSRCLQWLHNSSEYEALVFEQECSIKLKMLPGKIYIGPEVK